jgi:hypothetical protein
MIRHSIVASAVALACGFAFSSFPAHAAATDYRFELVGKPQASGQQDIVQVRLVHVADGKPVSNAVIFETTADMGPEGMPTMPAPVKLMPGAKDGVYSVAVNPGMAGTWALHLSAKVQGEAETVQGTINADLAK